MSAPAIPHTQPETHPRLVGGNVMKWTEITREQHSYSAPTIKNHSVTHFNGFLYCFGGYDGQRNHMTLLVYSIAEKRWIQPVVYYPAATAATGDEPWNSASKPNDSPSDQHSRLPSTATDCSSYDHSTSAEEVESKSSFEDTSTTILVQGTPPPGRNGHSSTLAVDGADERESAKIVIIGGWLGTGPLAASDMHVLDIGEGGHRLHWYQPAVRGTPPGPCNMHSADYVAHRREVYVFRGGNGREYMNDLHALDVDTMIWRRVNTTGQVPEPRANHSSAMLEETHELCMFGGWNGSERLNDIHILDTMTSNWTRPRIGGILVSP